MFLKRLSNFFLPLSFLLEKQAPLLFPNLLQRWKKPLTVLLKAERYQITQKASWGYCRDGSFYWDTKRGFILWIKVKEVWEPVACVGFDVHGLFFRKSLFIKQIQARQKDLISEDSLEMLKEIYWERLFVDLVAKTAKQIGIKRVQVLPYSRSQWGEVRSNLRYKLRYDVTAKRLGFKWNEKTETYLLSFS